MTEFQDYIRRNPRCVLINAWEKFKEHYPNLGLKEAKHRFTQEISGVFFNGPPRRPRKTRRHRPRRVHNKDISK